MRRLVLLIAATLAAGLLPSGPAVAAVSPGAYRENDHLGFRNVLPPGTSGLATAGDTAAFATSGAYPPHSSEQLAMYGDLVYATPGLREADLDRYFKDASFGVPPGEEERTYSPREDVTIVRDTRFGVPHIYGRTRAGAMFGAGYVAGEDRMFFIDVLRHLGRAQLSSFVGGAQGNRDFDREQWGLAPYTEEDLQRQVDQFDELYGADGRQFQEDLRHYTAGVNAYVAQLRASPARMPAEYAAINRPQGPADWRDTDLVAIAALVGGIFGRGGGGELTSAEVLEAARERFGARGGRAVWEAFRTADDPESPTTVARRFPYMTRPRRVGRGGVALPDPGSLRRHEVRAQSTAPASSARGALEGILPRGALPGSASNALLVSARESESGRPIAVFGPQTAYFAPQILMEQDVHAPAADGRPGIDARGVAFPGTNLYVQLGRGPDYAWSATSAGQDIVDTFALELCEPDGSAATLESMSYRYDGACLPIERLVRHNSWQPSAADQTPSGSETLEAQRTRLGLVAGRATLRGRPVVFASLRSTYMHEADSGLGFLDLNAPERVRDARGFRRAVHRIGYAFNWFYADDRDIAYFLSGDHPLRARGSDPDLPVPGERRWRGWRPDLWLAPYAGARRHPQGVNPPWFANWNNKQAPGFRAADDKWSWGAVQRVESLERRLRAGTRGRRKMDVAEVVEAMEEAGTVDLRAREVLPWALRVLGRRREPELRDAVAKLEAWLAAGAQRRDRDRDGTYEHAEAIRILDAWWPLWMRAQFEPALGEELFGRVERIVGIDNEPNNGGGHVGSAYEYGWYGYASKDLRRALGRRVRGAWPRTFCGGDARRDGSLARCRAALAASLGEALALPHEQVYGADPVCDGQAAIGPSDPGRRAHDQWCHDAVWHRPLGVVNHPLIHWINRPTFQQVVSVEGHRPR